MSWRSSDSEEDPAINCPMCNCARLERSLEVMKNREQALIYVVILLSFIIALMVTKKYVSNILEAIGKLFLSLAQCCNGVWNLVIFIVSVLVILSLIGLFSPTLASVPIICGLIRHLLGTNLRVH